MRKLSSILLSAATAGAVIVSTLAVAATPAAAEGYDHGRYERHAHFDRHRGFERHRHFERHRYEHRRWR